MRGLCGTCWEAGLGKPPIVLPCADDHVIAPEHPGLLAVQLMAGVHEMVDRDGFERIVGLSAGWATALQSLAMGWRAAGPMSPVGRHRLRGSGPRVVRTSRPCAPLAV